MGKKSYVFKSDLVNLIQEQTGLSRRASVRKADIILLREESLANQVFGFAGGAIYSGVIQNFVEQILDAVGIPSDKLLGRIIANFIENLSFEQIQGYLSEWDEGACESFMKSLVDVMVESLAEYLIDELFEKFSAETVGEEIGIPEEGPVADMIGELGFEFDDMDNIKNIVGGIVREKIFDTIFTQEKRQDIVNGICDAMSNLDFNLEGLKKAVGMGEKE